ncbi:hypothetical protein KKP97_02775 [Methanothermococcus sp. SCGC AD-155-C09]|nr:hypothetical protein [Methanothermococcus sp. SCGC AD-155-C09]
MGYKFKGQISIDAVLAITFIILITSIISYNIFNTLNNVRESEIVDRGQSIMDVFENYALIAYSKGITLSTTFEPIGDIGYTIRFSNKVIMVNNKTNILFKPEHNQNGTYINITGDSLSYTNTPLEPNIVHISFGDFYVTKNISVNIR